MPTTHPRWHQQRHGIRRLTGAQLRVQREFLGFSRSQLAEILGITAGVIADWEDGRDPTPYDLPDTMATILRFTDEYIDAMATGLNANDTVLTYRTDTAYRTDNPDAVYTASWHRRVCARLLQDRPGLRVDFH